MFNSTTSYIEEGDNESNEEEMDGQKFDNNPITIITVMTITFLIALALIITVCIIQRQRQKRRWNKRLKMTERKMNAIAQDLKITKEMACKHHAVPNAVHPVVRNHCWLPKGNNIVANCHPPLSPLPVRPSASLPATITAKLAPVDVYDSLEGYCCTESLTSCTSHDFYSEKATEKEMNIDVFTPMYNGNTLLNGDHYVSSFLSTNTEPTLPITAHRQPNLPPTTTSTGFLSLQTITTYQSYTNDSSNKVLYNTLSTAAHGVHPTSVLYSSTPVRYLPNTVVSSDQSDHQTIKPSSDPDTLSVPNNTPNDSLHCYRLTVNNDESMCSTQSATLTMYTCPSTPGQFSELEVEEEGGEETDTERWV